MVECFAMSRPAAEIMLSPEERSILELWSRPGRAESRFRQRARIILKAAEGRSTSQIAAELRTRPSRVSKWRNRFATSRIGGLQDKARPGRAAELRYPKDTAQRILDMLNTPPPKGYAHWTGTLLAEALGDVKDHKVWKVLRQNKISLSQRRSWCVSTDPEFAAKAADIVGLYLNPPANAVVLCVDEKPCIQALERAQGWLRMADGKALSGFNHEYKRHGTTTLFAALETATGLIKASQFPRRRRREFLQFMNELVELYPDQELHVILDNLNTHKPKEDRWLRQHPKVHFHFTPTHASWLNQVETWFSILSRQALRGASFTSVAQLSAALQNFVEAYNPRAHPFEWTKSEVGPKGLKVRIERSAAIQDK
jgi:transposase